MVSKYKKKVFIEINKILEKDIPFNNILDFGSGDGWFSHMFMKEGLSKNITSLDVIQRNKCFANPIIFNGNNIPFPDKHFDLTFTSDVIHHTAEPELILKEILRCTKKTFLIKDHSFTSKIDFFSLCFLDIIGNSFANINCPFNYQKEFKWFEIIEREGFKMKSLVHPLQCHTGITGILTNHLQFISLWERIN